MSDRIDVGGKAVIVTGGGRGIGKVYCEALAAMGASVLVADIDDSAAAAVSASINADHGRAASIVVDVGDERATLQMAEACVAAFGRIDGLVNNAALMSTLPRRNWMEIPLEEWDRVMHVNLRGLFLCCRAVYAAMAAQKQGAIVNISSNRVFEGTPNRLHYTTSKAGVIGFTRALAREVGGDNIRVNAVAPGLTLSDAQIASSDADYLERLAEGRALRRHQQADDLVGAVAFLLSDASAYITGQTINVDGGKMMH